LARAAAVALAVASLAGALAPAASAGWGKPRWLVGPQSDDVQPARLAFSAAGAASIAFAVQDPDTPQNARAFIAQRSAAGQIGKPRHVPGALAVLGLTYQGSALELLTGSSPKGRGCCATVQAVPVSGSRFGKPSTLVRGLTGTTDGELVPLAAGANAKGGGGMLAALATQRGVWVAQTNAKGAFTAARRLSFAGAPADVAAAALPGGGAAVAWTVATGGYDAQPQQILFATGSSTSAPKAVRAAVTVPAGHSIDQLALEPGAKVPTLAWIESWSDALGRFHSVLEVRDLTGSAQAQTVSPSFELASDLAFAANGAGDQVLAYDGCSNSGACVARAATRQGGRPFAGALYLGAVDPSQQVATAISSKGDALVGWISPGGAVLAAAHSLHAARFGRGQLVAATSYAADLTLAFGAGRRALAAWTQGSVAPVIAGAMFSG
jgi:hypothetical protein